MTDSLSPRARELLDNARAGDEPSDGDRARVRRALTARVAIGVAATVAVTTTAKAAATTAAASAGSAGAGTAAAGFTLGIGTKVLLSAAFVGMVGMGTASYLETKRDASPAVAPAVVAVPPVAATTPVVVPLRDRAKPSSPPPVEATAQEQPVAPQATELEAPPLPGPQAQVARDVPLARHTAPAPSTAAPHPADRAEAKSPTGVAAEIAFLREAQAALSSGDASRALALIDAHVQRFPRGSLGEEREAARIFALCALGRTDAARASADVFLRLFPRSLQAPRVRASCGGPGQP